MRWSEFATIYRTLSSTLAGASADVSLTWFGTASMAFTGRLQRRMVAYGRSAGAFDAAARSAETFASVLDDAKHETGRLFGRLESAAETKRRCNAQLADIDRQLRAATNSTGDLWRVAGQLDIIARQQLAPTLSGNTGGGGVGGPPRDLTENRLATYEQRLAAVGAGLIPWAPNDNEPVMYLDGTRF
jgi:hypothetical protein